MSQFATRKSTASDGCAQIRSLRAGNECQLAGGASTLKSGLLSRLCTTRGDLEGGIGLASHQDVLPSPSLSLSILSGSEFRKGKKKSLRFSLLSFVGKPSFAQNALLSRPLHKIPLALPRILKAIHALNLRIPHFVGVTLLCSEL